jgi:hypothetical protein
MSERRYDLEATFEGNTFVTLNLPYLEAWLLCIEKIQEGCWPVVVRPVDKLAARD